MFWQSIFHGLGGLLYWETYVVAIVYLGISFAPIVAMILAGDKAIGLIAKGGCLVMLVFPLFQALAVFVSVCILFPIMLFDADDASWSLPWMVFVAEPVKTLIALIDMVVFSFIGSLLPILGRMVSFIMFIMGAVAIVLLVRIIQKIDPSLGIQDIELFPGWLTIVPDFPYDLCFLCSVPRVRPIE